MANICDLFIIESCSNCSDDFIPEGEDIVHALHRIGKKPILISVENKDDLKRALKIFKASKYRYLHFSCHGTDSDIALANGDNLSYQEFAQISHNCFNIKRIFFSACELGNCNFSNEIAMQNVGIQSIVAPIEKESSITLASFWCAFYTSILLPELSIDINSKLEYKTVTPKSHMKLVELKRKLCLAINLYGRPFHISYHETSKDVLYHEKLKPLGKTKLKALSPNSLVSIETDTPLNLR